jgi:NTE family protein
MPEQGTGAAEEKRIDLVFEGGGVKGIGLVGALSLLLERGYQPQNVAGTSAGAVVAAGLAAGYTAAELRRIVGETPFSSFLDQGWEDRLPGIGTLVSILRDQGIYEGEAFQQWMAGLLEAKGIRTFKDLVHPAYADAGPRYRYRAQMIASDITGRCLLVLPQDAPKIGIAPDDLNVALAVRMSMSIPIFFEPVRWRNPQTGREHLIVDGGMLSNYPVWLFDSAGVPEWPTFGLRLVEDELNKSVADRLPEAPPARTAIGVVVDYVKSLVATMLEAHDRLYIEKANYARTVTIPSLGVSSVDFNLKPETVDSLFESGRAAAERFLENWTFEGYIAEFRSGKEHSRRAEVAADMQVAEASPGRS